MERSSVSQFKDALGNTKKTHTLYDKVCEVLDPESFKDFESAMADSSVTHTDIARALRSLGISVSDNTIRRWRSSL